MFVCDLGWEGEGVRFVLDCEPRIDGDSGAHCELSAGSSGLLPSTNEINTLTLGPAGPDGDAASLCHDRLLQLAMKPDVLSRKSTNDTLAVTLVRNGYVSAE